MGASSSIHTGQQPHIHICGPVGKYTNKIQFLKNTLEDNGFQVTMTCNNNSISENNIFKSDLVVCCISQETSTYYDQLREMDIFERCYKKSCYLMLDSGINPEEKGWVKVHIQNKPWIKCESIHDISHTTEFLKKHINSL